MNLGFALIKRPLPQEREQEVPSSLLLRERVGDKGESSEYSATPKFSMTKLRQCGNQWNFYNESELEDFVWTHLKSLLGLLPLKRQFSIQGQFCNILAITSDEQLVVIELNLIRDRGNANF